VLRCCFKELNKNIHVFSTFDAIFLVKLTSRFDLFPKEPKNNEQAQDELELSVSTK
jgi:hypothetical protein